MKVLLLMIPVLLLSACDSHWSWGRRNFVWYAYPLSGYHLPMKGYYSADRSQVWAVMRWSGTGQLGYKDDFVLLCLRTSERAAENRYELIGGVVMSTAHFDGTNPHLSVVGALQAENLHVRQEGKRLRVTYEGDLSGLPEPSGPRSGARDWAKFDVALERDEQRTRELMIRTGAILEQAGKAPELVECMADLADAGIQ